MEQPPRFEDSKRPNHVYKSNALYGSKQSPRAWYERLIDFLFSKGFIVGMLTLPSSLKGLEGFVHMPNICGWHYLWINQPRFL